MRNWINIINDSISEDLEFGDIKDHEIVLDDPENDEVETLCRASPEKKQSLLRDLEKTLAERSE